MLVTFEVDGNVSFTLFYLSTNVVIPAFPQFATVYKARDKTNDTIVAIKKVKSLRSGMNGSGSTKCTTKEWKMRFGFV